MVTTSSEPTHILLTGPPASAKTMFLLSLLNSLKNTYFIDGGNATKAGIIDYLLANHPQYLLIDEIDKMSRQNQTFLLNLMETGILSETKYRITVKMQMRVQFVFQGDIKLAPEEFSTLPSYYSSSSPRL